MPVFHLNGCATLKSLMYAATTAKVRIFLVSDTHGYIPTPSSRIFRAPLPKCDVFIHAGDLTNTGELRGFRRTLGWIKEVDAELKIIIAGNHDLSLDKPWYTIYGDDFHKEPQDPTETFAALPPNIHYLNEESKTFTLASGATFKVYGSPWTPEFGFWAFNYPRDVDRWNPSDNGKTEVGKDPIPEDVDAVVTHGPPRGFHDKVSRTEEVGCPHLRKAIERIKPRLHVFGHIHEGHGVTRVTWRENGGGEESRRTAPVAQAQDMREAAEASGACPAMEVDVSSTGEMLGENETLVVNASVVNLSMSAVHAGVLVDMDFPVQTGGEDVLDA